MYLDQPRDVCTAAKSSRRSEAQEQGRLVGKFEFGFHVGAGAQQRRVVAFSELRFSQNDAKYGNALSK